MYGQNQRLVRVTNQLLILEELRRGAQSRVDLARKLRLSNPGVSKIVETFIQKGLILETGAQATRAGRRPVLLEFNARFGCVCAVEVGAHCARAALGDLRGEILRTGELMSFETFDSLALSQLSERMTAWVREAGEVCGVLLGLTLSYEPGERAETLQRLEEGVRLFSDSFDCQVRLKNSVQLAAAGASLRSEMPEEGLLYLLVGQGISCGVFCPSRGEQGLAKAHALSGELSESIPDASSAVAEWRGGRISKRNTLEEQATPDSVLRTLQEKFSAGEGYLGEHSSRPEDITLEDVKAAAAAGDSECLYAIQNAAVRLAVAAANLLRVIPCSTVLVDGTAKAFGTLYMDSFAQFLREAMTDSAPAKIGWAQGADLALLGGVSAAADRALHTLAETM